MDRRDFIVKSSAASLLACFPASLEGLERTVDAGQLERRALGRTAERLSIIGFGGIVVMNATSRRASTRVAEAIDHGVNYFDVAPSYGNAEDMLGPALEAVPQERLPGVQDDRTEPGRGAAGARALAAEDADRSLRSLPTARRHHARRRGQDLRARGALEAFVAARKAGKVRFLGFSAHSVEASLALIERFDFDTILFPRTSGRGTRATSGRRCSPRRRRSEWASSRSRRWHVGPGRRTPSGIATRNAGTSRLPSPPTRSWDCRFTLSHPVTAAIPPGDETLFKQALGLRCGSRRSRTRKPRPSRRRRSRARPSSSTRVGADAGAGGRGLGAWGSGSGLGTRGKGQGLPRRSRRRKAELRTEAKSGARESRLRDGPGVFRPRVATRSAAGRRTSS